MAQPTSNNPSYFGRPGWSYVDVVRGPVRGPQPRLAKGTGRTGRPAASGTGPQLPAYLSDNDYRPSPFSYQPRVNESFLQIVPRTINTGNNGRELVGTYQPHDFIPGQRFNHQMRRAENWQVQEYGPGFRSTQAWQQVQLYRVMSNTRSAHVLASSQYFLGYQVQPEVSSQIGQNTLGYMGSV